MTKAKRPRERARIYDADAHCALRKSHENPAVLRLYGEFFTDGPCGHKSHELLHTTYVARGKHIG